jgi:hypothetical protein
MKALPRNPLVHVTWPSHRSKSGWRFVELLGGSYLALVVSRELWNLSDAAPGGGTPMSPQSDCVDPGAIVALESRAPSVAHHAADSKADARS